MPQLFLRRVLRTLPRRCISFDIGFLLSYIRIMLAARKWFLFFPRASPHEFLIFRSHLISRAAAAALHHSLSDSYGTCTFYALFFLLPRLFFSIRKSFFF